MVSKGLFRGVPLLLHRDLSRRSPRGVSCLRQTTARGYSTVLRALLFSGTGTGDYSETALEAEGVRKRTSSRAMCGCRDLGRDTIERFYKLASLTIWVPVGHERRQIENTRHLSTTPGAPSGSNAGIATLPLSFYSRRRVGLQPCPQTKNPTTTSIPSDPQPCAV